MKKGVNHAVEMDMVRSAVLGFVAMGIAGFGMAGPAAADEIYVRVGPDYDYGYVSPALPAAPGITEPPVVVAEPAPPVVAPAPGSRFVGTPVPPAPIPQVQCERLVRRAYDPTTATDYIAVTRRCY